MPRGREKVKAQTVLGAKVTVFQMARGAESPESGAGVLQQVERQACVPEASCRWNGHRSDRRGSLCPSGNSLEEVVLHTSRPSRRDPLCSRGSSCTPAQQHSVQPLRAQRERPTQLARPSSSTDSATAPLDQE